MATKSNILQIVINGRNRTGKAFRSVAAGAKRMGVAAAAAFRVLGVAAAAAGAALGASAFRAAKFEQGLAEIGTLLDGNVGPAIGRMRGELLKMSAATGQSIDKLVKARYDIVSAGFTDAADSAAILAAASDLAIAGVSDVATTADLLTTAVNGLGASSKDAGRIADILFQTVRKGKTTVGELAASMGPLFATAKVAGVGLEELGGVMATLTANGVNTAESTTALNGLLLALAAPSGEAKKALDALGISLDEGLAPALVKLSDVGDDGLAALAKIIPNIRALKAASVAAADIDKLTANIAAMGDASGVTKSAVIDMGDTAAIALYKLKSTTDVLVISLGEKLLPVFQSLVNGITRVMAVVSFMAGKAEDGRGRWRDYGQAMMDAIPGANALADAVAWVGKQIKAVNGSIEDHRLSNERERGVEKIIKELLIQKRAMESAIGSVVSTVSSDFDVAALRKTAEALYDIRDARGEIAHQTEFKIVAGAKAVASDISDIFQQMDKDMKAAETKAAGLVRMAEIVKEGMMPTTTAAAPQALGPAAPQEVRDSQAAQLDAVTDAAKAAGDALAKSEEEAAAFKDQLVSLSAFIKDDFASVAFNVSDSMASMVDNVAAHMIGLQKGPIMIGQMFKQMAVGVISDLAHIVARMMAARALMAIFGLATGGAGTVISGGISSFATGASGMQVGSSNASRVFGTIASGASGLLVGGANAARSFGSIVSGASGMQVGSSGIATASFVMPGAVGVDRTLVMAHGGEVMIPRQTVQALDRSRGRATASPPVVRRNRGRKIEIINQLSRPFDITEQMQLSDSVTEGLRRSTRHRG